MPLILHWPAGAGRPARIDEPASLIDVAPTVLDFLGVPAPPQFQGHSLLKSSAAEQPVYSESMYARDHLGCSPLRSILVISEVALALITLVGAGLFIRSMQNAQKINVGFAVVGREEADALLERPS